MMLADSLGIAYRMISDPETSRPIDGLDSFGGQDPQRRSSDSGGCTYSVSCFTCQLPDCYRNTNGGLPTPGNLAKRLGWSVARLEAMQQAAAQGRRGN